MDLTLVAGCLLVVSVPLIFIGMLVGARYVADRLVGDRHRLLQHIAETGQVPDAWRRRFARRIARASADPARLGALRDRAREAYLQKLDDLTRYVQYTKLIDTEETRQTLLSRLAEIRDKWAQGEEVG